MMQELFSLVGFPIGFGLLVLYFAGSCELKTFCVPNRLVLRAIVIAFAFAACKSWFVPEATGGIGPALFGALLGGVMLLPLYARVQLGAGCVKTHAAVGAWMGCAFDYRMCAMTMIAATACGLVMLAATWFSKARLVASDGSVSQQFVHGQVPISIGAAIGILAINVF